MIDAHPALKARLAPGAGHRLVRRRRLPPQRRASSCRTPSTSIASFGKPRPEPTTKWPPRFDHGTPDGYDFFLEAGPARRTPTRSTSRARSRSGTRSMQHGDLRRVLEGAQPAAAPEGHQAGRADRRRLVRRRGSLRRARDLPRDRAAEPRDREPAGDGPVGPRRLGRGDRRRRSATSTFGPRPAEYLPREHRVPVLRAAT